MWFAVKFYFVRNNNQENRLERMKTWATNSCLVLVLHRIGQESGASFLKQSQSEKKNPQNAFVNFN